VGNWGKLGEISRNRPKLPENGKNRLLEQLFYAIHEHSTEELPASGYSTKVLISHFYFTFDSLLGTKKHK
jgi:hypothetical protein